MDKRGKRQAAPLFGGMGFYIALLVCVVAAGTVGYYALLSDTDSGAADAPLQAVDNITDDTLPVANKENEDAREVISTQPVTVQPAPKPTLPEEDVIETGSEQAEPEIPVSGEVVVPEKDNETAAPVVSSGESTAASSRIVFPLTGSTVAVFSAGRLMYDATLDDWRTHDGIDISAPAGTDVAAAAAGTVIFVGEDDRLGVNIVIEHNGGYATTYASLHPEVFVSAGDKVAAGDIIGTVGNTSLTEAGLGAHLHFSVTRNGEIIDPEAYLPKES